VELNTWNVREFRMEDASGDTAVILYRPITHGWRTRHLELSLRIQKAVTGLSEATQGDPEALSEGAIEGVVASQQEAHEMMARFRGDLMRDLVVGCRDLTINDEVPSRDELLEALVQLEDLSADLCAHIIEEGSVSEEEGKD
jgi:hypothetical protein